MPFAPMTRIEDAAACYQNLDGAEHAAEFMTITFDCTDLMKKQSPAVVHVDGTARPQLVNRQSHPLIHEVITAYHRKTGIHSIRQHFLHHIHENRSSALRTMPIEGFLTSGLDYLYLEGGFIVSFQENQEAALRFIQQIRSKPSQKEQRLQAINQFLSTRLETCMTQLQEKESVIQSLAEAAEKRLPSFKNKRSRSRCWPTRPKSVCN